MHILSRDAVVTFYEELEKISSSRPIALAGIGGAAAGGLGMHLIQKADTRNDQLLMALGRLRKNEAEARKSQRNARSLIAAGVGGGAGALAAKEVLDTIPVVQAALGEEGKRAVTKAMHEASPSFLKRFLPK